MLKDRVTIQRPVVSQDALGGTTVVWSDIVTVWAQVAPATGREKEIAARIRGVQTTIIKIRHIPGISEDMRVVHGSDIYNIHTIERSILRRAVWLKLTCTKGENDG